MRYRPIAAFRQPIRRHHSSADGSTKGTIAEAAGPSAVFGRITREHVRGGDTGSAPPNVTRPIGQLTPCRRSARLPGRSKSVMIGSPEGSHPCGPSLHLAEHGHQLVDLCSLLVAVARRDRMLNAMRDVLLEHLFLDPLQRSSDGRHLRYDVDTITVLLQHPKETPYLPFDPPQALDAGRLGFRSHASHIPRMGI